MNDRSLLGPWIRRFLLEHLIGERNFAHNTQISYRDTFVLLFPFVSKSLNKPIDKLSVEHISADIVRQFLLQKVRRCPLWPDTINKLTTLVVGRGPEEPVFLNRRKQPITRFGIYALVKRSVQSASQKLPSLSTKQISTHTIRYTTAVHLLRSGVDINTIRAWLGHVSLDTTHIYAEVDLEMKAKALAQFDIPPSDMDVTDHWSNNPELMAFLKSL